MHIDEELFKTQVSKKQNELQNLYDSFCYVDDPEQLSKVESLLSKIGTIDLFQEGYVSQQHQRDLSIKFHWGHNHTFNESLSVNGRMADRHVNLMAQFMVRYGLSDDFFNGKDVLDVGCWTGGTTLLLKALGANRVVALEEVVKYQKAAQTLVVDIYAQENTNCAGGNLYSFEDAQKFDVIYFPGVIYHLSDPVLALRRLFNAARDGAVILVETMGLDQSGPVCEFHGNRVYSNGTIEELNRGGWNWFVPAPECLSRWMLEAGFVENNSFYSDVSKRVFSFGKRVSHQDITRAGLSVPEIF